MENQALKVASRATLGALFLVVLGCRESAPPRVPDPPSAPIASDTAATLPDTSPPTTPAPAPAPAPVPVAVLDRCAVDRPAAVWRLPAEMAELSGLAVDDAGRVLAHDDERGRFLVVDPGPGRPIGMERLEGTPRDDFEGIAATPDGVILMTSRGRLYRAWRDGGDAMAFDREETGLGQRCELEGLALDRARGVLFLPCKRPRDPVLSGALVVFRWLLEEGRPAEPGLFAVPLQRVGLPAAMPTAAAFDPVTGHLLVLNAPSSVVEFDGAGAVVGVRQLQPRFHRQPESIELLPGALLIGDEDPGGGTITIYRCQ